MPVSKFLRSVRQHHLFKTNMTVDVVVPVIFMPLTLLLATLGWFWTIATIALSVVALIAVYYHTERHNSRNRFFIAWSLTAYTFLIAVFQLEVVPYMEILFFENFMLMVMVSVAAFSSYFARHRMTMSPLTKADSLAHPDAGKEEWSMCDICRLPQFPRCGHCKTCGICVSRLDHHCVWLDACIGEKNHRLYVIALIGVIGSCFYYAHLTLTTICNPILIRELFLFPKDCSDVYGDFHIALCYVSALYVIVIGAWATLKLIHQSWLICLNTTFHEWKQGLTGEYSKGVASNCAEFWCRQQ